MIYFIFPIYNERENLPNLLGSVRQFMGNAPYRIVAVNDGSRDGSYEYLTSYADPNLVTCTSTMNMNVGAVFARGIHKALETAVDDDVVIIMEGDQTSDINVVKLLVEQINQGQDVVIASRYLPGGAYVNFPIQRRVFSYVANLLMRKLFPVGKVFDYTIFFRAYRAGILRKASLFYGPFGLIQSKGFTANAELLIKLSLLTGRITEVPFIYNYGRKKGKSKINVLRTISEYRHLISYLKLIYKKKANLN